MSVIDEITNAADSAFSAGGEEAFDLLPDGTWEGGMRKYQREITKDSCERQVRQGTLTFAHMLDAKAHEALAEEDKVRLRAVLIEVATCSVLWIQKLDREKI